MVQPEDLLVDAKGVAAITRFTGGDSRLLERVARILAVNELATMIREMNRGGSRGLGDGRGVGASRRGRFGAVSGRAGAC
jgi:hypothetical protein